MKNSSVGRRVLALVVLVGAAVVMLVASTAMAHTGLESSSPSDGDTVTGPVRRVVMVFTGTPVALDDSFAVANAAGDIIRPTKIVQRDLRIVARFNPPLPPAAYAASWQVRSDDTHTITGTFGFVVEASPTTTTTQDIVAEATTAPPPDAPASTESRVAATAPIAAPVLEDNGGGWGSDLARSGRLVSYPALLAALGIVAFEVLSFAGSSGDRVMLRRLTASLGAVISVGSLAEFIGLSDEVGGFTDAVGEGAGRAALLRLLGGLLLAFGAPIEASWRRRRAASDGSPRALPPAIWMVGLAMLSLSFGFDGHTVSEGPRLVHSLATVVHVVAGGIWAGGVLAIAVLITVRRRQRRDAHALEMVLSFSFVAGLSLAVVAVAGALMAWFIDLEVVGGPSTAWGWTLWIKVALVAVTASLGAYNHFRLRPRLERSGGDAATVVHLQRTVVVEAVALVLVGVLSAVLVTASTV